MDRKYVTRLICQYAESRGESYDPDYIKSNLWVKLCEILKDVRPGDYDILTSFSLHNEFDTNMIILKARIYSDEPINEHSSLL